MERPMSSVDDKEELAQAEEIIEYSKNSKEAEELVSSEPDSDEEIYNPKPYGFDVPYNGTKEELMEKYSGDAEFAIKEYNKMKATKFKVVGIENANYRFWGGMIDETYITFAAVDENVFGDPPKMFQALVSTGVPRESRLPCFGEYTMVELCRQKDYPDEGFKRFIQNDKGRSWGCFF